MSTEPEQAARARDAETFRVLGHETRLRLLALLAKGELAVGAIDVASGIGQPGLSQQLAILRKAQLVSTRRVAKQVYYRIDPRGLQRAASLLGRLTEAPASAASARRSPDSDHPRRSRASAANFARLL